MAITRTVFKQTSSATAAAAEMLTWLQTNASDYFTDIISGDDNAVICKIGDLEALTLYPSGINTTYVTKIKLAVGTTYSYSNAQTFPRAYKTDNGIAIFDSYYRPIFITKDVATNNTLIFAAMLSSSTLYYYCFDIANGASAYMLSSDSYSNFTNVRSNVSRVAGATALCPIIFGNTGAYSEGLFLAVFNQNVNATETIIKIGDKQYVFDGAIALEE